MRPEILSILRCPENHSPLRVASDAEVQETNAEIRAGRLQNRAGRALEQTIDSGLVRERGDVLYPIIDGIPVLLGDEAILLNQAGGERPEGP